MTDHQATMEGPPPREESFVDKAINGALAAYASPGFWPGVALAIGISACYWSLFMGLPDLWDSPDGYYSHGFLVPFISAYIVGKNWEKLRSRPVTFGWLAIPFLLLNFFILRAAFAADLVVLLSFSLVATLMLLTWLIAGFRWMTGLALPILYLLFALPIWTFAIEVYTNPLQSTSTGVAFSLLKLLGFNPMRDQASTTIYLDHFTLDVGVPCSGFKLIIAVTAFTVFFTLIANLRWWSNLVMFGMIIPLGLFINGLRVAMIGMVGDGFGADAGMAFHDWSGYITLLICFFILFKIARGLGWKD
ncbi:MAG: exosortase/archaeosortase family protein [Armatimonadetes bacterium]|nr:exosortase/archaeosortase family protein [Armatimonadota bacterium]